MNILSLPQPPNYVALILLVCLLGLGIQLVSNKGIQLVSNKYLLVDKLGAQQQGSGVLLAKVAQASVRSSSECVQRWVILQWWSPLKVLFAWSSSSEFTFT